MTIDSVEVGGTIHPDVILSAVAHEQRRAVLRTLDRTDEEELDVGALAAQVSAQVRNGESPDDHRQRVHIALRHTHLPKLVDCGMVDYDRETGRVRAGAGDLSRELLPVIESFEARE